MPVTLFSIPDGAIASSSASTVHVMTRRTSKSSPSLLSDKEGGTEQPPTPGKTAEVPLDFTLGECQCGSWRGRPWCLDGGGARPVCPAALHCRSHSVRCSSSTLKRFCVLIVCG